MKVLSLGETSKIEVGWWKHCWGGGISKFKERPQDICPRGELEFRRGSRTPKDTMEVVLA